MYEIRGYINNSWGKIKIDYEAKIKEYLDTFGENSLDRILRPGMGQDRIEGFEKFYKEIDDAIKNKKPMKQASIEIFDRIVR